MQLTPAQLATLRADILGNADTLALYQAGDRAGLAAAYNADASPDWWVWKTLVTESEITGTASVDGTTWSWPAFIARSVQEQQGWARMFGPLLTVDPSKPNVRQGFADIFSGVNNNAPAQRTHLLAMGRRKATRMEKLFSTGTGSTGNPATMTVEGLATPELFIEV